MTSMHQIHSGGFIIGFGERPGLVRLARADWAAVLACNPAGLCEVWSVYDPKDGVLEEIPGDSPAVETHFAAAPDGARWRAEVRGKSGTMSAEIRAAVLDGVIRFELVHVEESPRAHLVSLRLNGLVAAVQADSAARLALPSHGGRLIDPARCADGATDHRYNWILDSFGSVAVACTDRMTAVARIHLMDDQLTSRVGGVRGARWAQVGALLRRRYTKLDASYRRAKPDRDPANAEDAGTLPVETDFLLDQTPCATVDLIAHDAVSPAAGWTIGAKHVRDGLPGKRTDYYRGRMVYKIFVGAPNQPVATSLAQMRALVFEVAARTGNAGQSPYIVGFQHRGHDSGYPDVFTLNPALESVDALQKLVEDARAVNCNLSFHDNYDDAYANSPMWRADDISRDHTGHLLRGGIWNGVQAYWNSMPYYARHRASERIRRTLEAYPFLKDTYHLDVLTASVFRIDFRGGDPTGRQDDLAARLDIVDQFRERGIDTSSEACGLPFVGHISYFWHMQRVPRALYEGDSRIPMVTFLAHGKADYAGTHTDDMHCILDGLLYGGFYCNDVTAATPIKHLTDAYYMLQAPLDLLRDDFAEDYQEENGWKCVRYASGARVAVNYETEECRVVIDGKTLIENGSAMLPQPDGSVILYRCKEEPYEDVRWRTGVPAGARLTAEPIGVALPARTLTVEADGCVPVDTELGVAWRVRRAEV